MTDNPNIGGVSKETFMDAAGHTKDGFLFDMLAAMDNRVSEYCDDINKRIAKLEAKRKTDTAVAAGSGFAGGFVAVLGKLIFWK